MASKFYPKGLKAFADGDIDFLVDDIKAVLVDTGAYTYNDTHEFLSDIPGGARIGTSPSLSTKDTTDGVLDAADTNFGSPAAGTSCEAVAFYKDTGNAATSRLFLWLESDKVSGLPVTTNGQQINITFDNGANKIAKL